MARVDRRTFLAAALATTAVRTAWTAGIQQPASSGRRWIDLHHHFAPPAWVTEVRGRPLLQPANTRWTVEQSIEDMDRGGVAAAVVSITNPGLWFGDAAQTRRLARACNDYGATLIRDHASRFGVFAALPLPDVDAALKEIEYAYDTLKVDGIGLYTSYGDTWLGAPAFRPVMAELNRRKALVTVHPTAADCCRNLGYAAGIGPGTIEYGTDTTRAIIGVAFNGDATRYPDIRFVWSHAGGSAPFLAGRIDGASAGAREALPDGFIAALRRFHFDVAGAANRGALAALTQWVPTSQIVFGTDFPPGGSSASVRAALAEVAFLSPSDLQSIGRDNALRLLPRFA